HMLRRSLGDEVFFRGLRLYYNAHAQANAGTEDLRAALDQASGKKLKDFFDRWVYESGHPIYELSWNWDPGKRQVNLTLRQTQTGPPFHNVVPVDIVTAREKQRVRFEGSGTREFKLDAPPAAILLDPDDSILKESIVKQSPR